MCGLTGFLLAEPTALADADAVLARMTQRLAHRGPDAQAIWRDAAAGIGLGHRRLSILDLSAAGAQPMASHDGRFVASFNGEIYNYLDVRRELERGGPIDWRGHADTEVLLEAIARWGLQAALQRMEGMFALALWDRQARTLHLARDRFGEKPLYYGIAAGHLLFASELKALEAFPGFAPGIDRDALAEFMRYGYVPAPASIHRGIAKLPPGTRIELRAERLHDTLPAPVAWWSATDAARAAQARPFEGEEADAAAQLDALLRRAVESRMQSDVPLGALLSGGIDSSTVVALMQAQRRDRVRTFCIGSDAPGFDEARHARAVAAHLGTDHTELYVTARDALDVVPLLPTMYDEPFADSSQVPTFLVSRLARQHVTVALSGDGGDELFGGYNRYVHGARLWRRLRGLPVSWRRLLARGMTAATPSLLDRGVALAGRMAPSELAAGRAGDKLHKLAGFLSSTSQDELHRRMLSLWPHPESFVLGSTRRESDGLRDDGDFAEHAMLADTLRYLPDDILAKVDRASMAVGLEARVPFLDSAVFDFAWRLPLHLRIQAGRGKPLLRRVLAGYVPPALFERPKQGFAVPVGQWLRGELREWAQALLDPARLRAEGYLDPGPIAQCWREHLSGRRNWDSRLWTVLMFQAWLERRGATGAVATAAVGEPAAVR
jgi:asparagine synthase (glutamine-hydrolysing)